MRGLYAITPDGVDDDALVAQVAAAIDGGAAAVQYRAKARPARVAAARALARLCAARGVLFIVNDDAALARDVDADGVHVGEDDGDVAQARSVLAADRIVGVSCYDDFARAEAAAAGDADYVAFGSFFPSSVKPHARCAGVDLLLHGRALGVPVVAIGGITAANAPALIAAGASAVAVISDVFAAADPQAIEMRARRIASLFAPRATEARSVTS